MQEQQTVAEETVVERGPQVTRGQMKKMVGMVKWQREKEKLEKINRKPKAQAKKNRCNAARRAKASRRQNRA